jgi:hypothetical protein
MGHRRFCLQREIQVSHRATEGAAKALFVSLIWALAAIAILSSPSSPIEVHQTNRYTLPVHH